MTRTPFLACVIAFSCVAGITSATIVFGGSGHRGPESHGIFISDAPYRAARTLYEPKVGEQSVCCSAISPDRTEIVFRIERNNQYDLYRMSIEGGEPTRLTDDVEAEFNIDWLHDERIVFSVSKLPRLADLVRLDLTSGKRFKYPNLGSGAVVSPDGSLIAYVAQGEIHIMDIDGNQGRRIADGVLPSWSPDGERIAFSTLWGISVVDIDTGKVSPIPNPNGISLWSPADWSEDGRTLVGAYALDPHPILLIDIESGEATWTSIEGFSPRWLKRPYDVASEGRLSTVWGAIKTHTANRGE